LSEALANYDNGGISIREGLVRRGDEFATRAISYDDVRRLGNDVSRSGALGGRVLLLKAGAPLYSHENINADALLLNGRARVRRLWCGANGSSGYCLVRRQSGWEAAEVRAYSPYAPMSLGAFVPVTDAQLETDQTASAELPTRTEVYRLAGADRARAAIARSIRIGDDTFDIDEIEAKQMRLGSLIVQIEPGPESDSATIGFVALDPADYQSDLRRRARDILRSN
jgi:hypothetical protein